MGRFTFVPFYLHLRTTWPTTVVREDFPPHRDALVLPDLDDLLGHFEIHSAPAIEVECLPEYTFQARSEWTTRCFLIKGGKGELRIEGQRYALEPGELIFIPANVIHSIEQDAANRLRFQLARFRILLAGAEAPVRMLGIPYHIPTAGDPVVASLFEEMVVESGWRSAGWWFSVAGNLARLLVHLMRAYGSHFTPELTPSRRDLILRMSPALRQIEENLSEPTSVPRLARAAHLSERQFRRLFHQLTTKSPARYLHERRLELACELLRTTKQPIEHIAAEVGFPDPPYFWVTFKKHIGQTPREYRHTADI